MEEKQTLLQLITAAQSHDTAAMTEILARFHPLIRILGRSTAGHDQEDLEQELALLLVQIVLKCDPAAWLSPPPAETEPRRFVDG